MLCLIREADADLAGLYAAMDAEMKAVAEQWMRRIGHARSRAKYWRWKFGAQLINWSKAKLAAMKQKSFTIEGGTLGSQTKTPGLEIVDLQRAIQVVRQRVPQALKIVKVDYPTTDLDLTKHALQWLDMATRYGVKIEFDVLKTPIKQLAKTGFMLPKDAFNQPDSYDEPYIDTGIKLPAGALGNED